MPAPFALPPPDPGFEIYVASQGMAQGLLQSEGMQVVPRAFVRVGKTQVGGLWRNISSPSASGVANFFVRTSRKFGDLQVDAGATYRIRTGTKANADATAWQFNGGGRLKLGNAGLRINAEYSPGEFENGQSLYVEAGSSLTVGKGVTLSANAGRRERHRAPDYTSFNAGMSKAVRERLTLDARYYQTDRGELGERYRGRIIISARLSF